MVGGAWTTAAVVGVDPNAAGTIIGAATIFGATVTQRMGNWVPGVQYAPTCTVATTLGDRLTLWANCPDEVIGC